MTKIEGKHKKMLLINADTHARLRALGQKDDSFDTIIRRLLDDAKVPYQ